MKRSRLGFSGYARALAALHDSGMTAAGITEAGLMQRNAANRFVQALHRRGRIFIESWIQPYRWTPQPVWRAGFGLDATYPTHRTTGRPARPRPKAHEDNGKPIGPELLSFVDMLDVMESRPKTAIGLAEATGLSIQTVRRAMWTMRACRLVRICGWQRRASRAGAPIPIYEFGRKDGRKCKRDAPRPHPESREVKNRRYRIAHGQPVPQTGCAISYVAASIGASA